MSRLKIHIALLVLKLEMTSLLILKYLSKKVTGIL